MKRVSFTLIELLVVISIMAILMAIIIPILRSSRQQAKTIICGSNIQQLTAGLLIYDHQNQVLPPSFDNTPMSSPAGGYPGSMSYDRIGWWWFNFIEGFYKSGKKESVINCPSKCLTNLKLKNDILCSNYGVNRSICKSSDDRQRNREEFVGTSLIAADILKPREILLIVDSGYAMVNWWQAADTPPVVLGNTIIEDAAYVPGLKINKNRKLWPGQEQDAINGRHPDKTVNVGFVDGHMSRKKADDLLVEKTDEGYKNKSPLWAPK